MEAIQPALVPGYYRCQNCGRVVDSVRHEGRFNLCAKCWSAIVEPTWPDYTGPLSPDLFKAREMYWTWRAEMERRYPSRLSWKRRAPNMPEHNADSMYPLCTCGRQRKVLRLGDAQPGLFDGPFARECPVCEARHNVESLFRLAPGLVPGRDEEDWLDLAAKAYPEAFELGVLPEYWFELKYGRLK